MSPSLLVAVRPCSVAAEVARGWERCPMPAIAVLTVVGVELAACGKHAEPWYAAASESALPEGATLAEVEYPALATR